MKENVVVFFPTGNIAKYERYKKAFEQAGIDYRRFLQIRGENGELKDYKMQVDEEGATALNNAEQKAATYYKAYQKLIPPGTKLYIMTTDEELHIDGLLEDNQPNLFVRRIQEPYPHDASDEEMVEKYGKIFRDIAENQNKDGVSGEWGYSLTLYGGNLVHKYNWIERIHFALNPKPGIPIPKGYPLNCMTIANKYENGETRRLSELSPEEAEQYFSRYTNAVAKFVKEHIDLEKEIEDGDVER